MAETLATYLKGKRCRGLRTRPVYFPEGDFVTLFVKDDLAHEDRVDELVTIYRSIANDEIVGCKIKGVKRLLNMLDAFGVIVAEKNLVLGFLFLAAFGAADKAERQPDVKEFAQKYGYLPVDREVAQAA